MRRSTSPAPITTERARQYTHDIVAFLEEQYICAETGKLIVLEQWQKDDILKPLFYDLNTDGTRKYTLALIGMPKKNGKSTFAGGVGLWFLFASEPHGEVIVAANNYDQASMIIYDKIKEAIRNNPNLKASAQLLKNRIVMKSTGTICHPIAAKYETAAGVNPTLVLFDELWGFPDRKFYDELTESPARRNPLSMIFTYAGYDKDSLLYSVYEQGKAGKDPSMFFYWSHENKASWVTQKYLDSQKARLPRNSYLRFHENRWTDASSEFVTEEDIALLHSVPWLQQYSRDQARPTHEYVLSCDAGVSHDRAARCVGHYDPFDGKIYVDSLMWWEGTKAKHIDMAVIEEDLRHMGQKFGITKMIIDPWQMEYMMQKLRPYFIVEPFNFNADKVVMSQNMITLIRGGGLVCYNEPLLDKELKEVVSKQTGKGWSIDHVRGKRDDLVISVGMMAMAVAKNSGILDFNFLDEGVVSPVGFLGIRDKEF